MKAILRLSKLSEPIKFEGTVVNDLPPGRIFSIMDNGGIHDIINLAKKEIVVDRIELDEHSVVYHQVDDEPYPDNITWIYNIIVNDDEVQLDAYNVSNPKYPRLFFTKSYKIPIDNPV